MPAYLITGRSGAGKTAICQELRAQGYKSFDGDRIAGLAGWVNPTSGLPTSVDYSKTIDKAHAQWRWSDTVLGAFLDQPGDLFLCGSADNQSDFYRLFKEVFILVLNPEIQRSRLLARTEHDYGKLPSMQEQVLSEQEELVATAIAQGAILIDAQPSVPDVVHTILEKIYVNR